MKNYSLISQEKRNYCLCSVVQAILDKDKKKFSQELIASQLNKDESGFYFNDSKFENFLFNQGYNFNLYSYNETPFNEPSDLLISSRKEHVLIAWDRHVVLMEEFRDPLLKYIDPSDGLIKEKDLGALLFNMALDKSGFFGIVSKR